ncbi:OPT oligopeptide transporter protein-domain-containing protein [Russula dissimulans]|nr:OPT oligopeptide transporter protein-domain-containing protein [Russula dissimulans]
MKYEQYSPLFLPITYAVTYGAFFALYPAVVVHTFLWYRRHFVRQFRRHLEDEKDIHSYLMRKYPEVPSWWFLALGIVSFVLGVIGIKVCHIGLPVWAIVVSVIYAILAILPIGIIQAISNQSILPNVLEEIIFGYVMPGRPLAMMAFGMMCLGTISQATTYSSDLKFGHYVKVPPRLMFNCQVITAIVSLLSSIVAHRWALDNIPDICSPNQKDFFTCPSLNILNTSSILWGGIGPKRLFSPGALYYPMLWGFLIGAVLPIPFYLLARRYPRSFWRYVNIPLALFAPLNVPSLSGPNYASWIL